MFKKALITLTICLTLTLSAKAEPILIDSECILVSDIFPAFGIHDKVVCGLNYGEEKRVTPQLASYIISKYNLKNVRTGTAVFKRKGDKVTESRVKSELEDMFAGYFPDTEIEVESVRLPDDLHVAPGAPLDIQIRKKRFGTVHFQLNNGYRTYTVSTFVKAFKKAAVTTDRVSRGERLDGKTEIKRIEITNVRDEVLSAKAGYVATRSLPEGRPVTKDMVKETPDGFKDKPVRVMYKTPALTIEVKGILLEDAYMGKIVRVQNTASGKIILAKYIGNGITISNY